MKLIYSDIRTEKSLRCVRTVVETLFYPLTVWHEIFSQLWINDKMNKWNSKQVFVHDNDNDNNNNVQVYLNYKLNNKE
jgi:hypothetical protein